RPGRGLRRHAGARQTGHRQRADVRLERAGPPPGLRQRRSVRGMTVAVVTDSASALPAPVAAAHGVTVVPIWLDLDGRSVRDSEAAAAEVLAAARVTTSGPSPGDFAAGLSTALERADAALVVTVAAGLSSTHGAAVLGAASFGERVRVLDTG